MKEKVINRISSDLCEVIWCSNESFSKSILFLKIREVICACCRNRNNSFR